MEEIKGLLCPGLYTKWIGFVVVFVISLYLLWKAGGRAQAWLGRNIRRLATLLIFLGLVLACLFQFRGCGGGGGKGGGSAGSEPSNGQTGRAGGQKTELHVIRQGDGRITVRIPRLGFHRQCPTDELGSVLGEAVQAIQTNDDIIPLVTLVWDCGSPDSARLMVLARLENGGIHVSESIPDQK